MSINSLSFLVGHLGLPTIDLTFKSCGSLILTTSKKNKACESPILDSFSFPQAFSEIPLQCFLKFSFLCFSLNSSNNLDKDFENSVITNSSTTDQQPDHFIIGKPVSLGAGENKTKSIKTMTKTFLKKKLYKRQKENTKLRRNASNTN